MKVRTLTLRGFRGFDDLALEFHERVTVFAGRNGAGKTSVLAALANLLAYLPNMISQKERPIRWLKETDIRNETDVASVEVVVSAAGGDAAWGASRTRAQRPGALPEMRHDVAALVEPARRSIDEGAPRLPLAVYFPASRPVREDRVEGWEADRIDPFAPYDAAFRHRTTTFRRFFRWFREREDIENERRLTVDDKHRDPELEAVRHAIGGLLPEVSELRVQRASHRIVVRHRNEVFAVDQLSDGQKNVLAMTGDLARRLALANRGVTDPLSQPAVVLIDEVELHLHPAWQRSILDSLCRAFPACQFIVTTHSPIVLGTVLAESIRLLDDFRLIEVAGPTRGRDANAILAEVMGVSARPDHVLHEVAEASRCIDEHDLEGARRRLDHLEHTLGWNDTEVIRLRTRLDFLETPLAEEP